MASKCHHCGKTITLKQKNICPNCGKNPYHCRKCGELITSNNLCYSCGFFICEHCGSCGGEEYNCSAIIVSNNPTELALIRKAFKIKGNPIRKICNRGVPHSHAKMHIPNMELKLNGFNVRTEQDRLMFDNRFEQYKHQPIGYKITISKEREDGFLGHELRIILNRLVCEGFYKIQRCYWIKQIKQGKRKGEEDKIFFDEFTRCEEKQCKHFEKDYAYKECPECKEHYYGNVTSCIMHDNPVTLKTFRKECDLCRLETKDFKKREVEKDGVYRGVYSERKK